MKATCWMGPQKMEVRDVPDPQILNKRDAIVKITSTAICGSDLHLYNGFLPMMEPGDIMGHEFMGEVVEVGSGVNNLKVGDRIVVPFPIACGNCGACQAGAYSLCENSNPNAYVAEKLLGHAPAGIFGYSHLTGGFAGGQAEFARVPFADVGHIKVPEGMTDEQVLFLSDILPTGYMGAEMCGIKPGDTVAVWGCGPVGQFAIASAYMLGAERVIAIDRFKYRLDMAREKAGAITINYEEVDSVPDVLKDLTAGRGPDHCIDAVGVEGHTHGVQYLHDRAKQMLRMQPDRPIALREAIYSCKSGGTVSVIGVYAGAVDPLSMQTMFDKQLRLRMGQANVKHWVDDILPLAQADDDPLGLETFATHHVPLAEAASAYEMFQKKSDGAIKVVFKP
jgi:threonine dehydrogenase-like Zn-dependent dehydrogenase